MLAITLIALVVLVTNQSVRFLQMAARGGIPATELLYLVGLQIPLLLGYLMPLGLYLGVLLTLAKMHIDSEMTVLAACGMGRWKLTKMLLIIASLVAAFVFWLMMMAVPRAQADINTVFQRAAERVSISQIVAGRFAVLDDDNSHVIFYAKKVSDNHARLEDVFLARKNKTTDSDVKASWNILIARTATEKRFPNDSQHYFLFKDGYRYVGIPGQKDYSVYRFQSLIAHLPERQFPEKFHAEYLPLSQLMKDYHTDLKAAAELQWRLAMPISVFVFVLLAIPLSEVKPRYGKFTQIFPAMLFYLVYAESILSARNTIAGGRLSPAIGMWLTHGLGLLVAFSLITYRAYFPRLKRLLRKTA